MKSLAPKIIFEDANLVVLDKPAGLLSQGEHTGDENLVDWLRTYFGRHYVGLIHRLDRNTSGIMVVAKRTKSANRLTEALQQGQLERSYLAWVHGVLPGPVKWKHFLEKDPAKNIVRVVKAGNRAEKVGSRPTSTQTQSVAKTSTQTKEAVLSARPIRSGLWKGNPVTLVEFILETGRSHQIRVQSTYEGFPLLGDTKYGSKKESPHFPRVALHSHRLSFPQPVGPQREVLRFECSLPADMQSVMDELKTV